MTARANGRGTMRSTSIRGLLDASRILHRSGPLTTPADRASDLAVFLREHRTRYEVVHAHAFCPPCDVGMATARALGKRALVKVATEGDPTEIAQGDARMQEIWRGLLQAGLVYEKLKQPEKAERFFRELVDKHTPSDEATTAKQHLGDR